MTIFRTKADVDNLVELRRRRAVLAARIKTQRQELKGTIQDIREDLKPAQLIKNTLDAFSRPIDSGILGAFLQNPTGLRLVTNFAITTLFRTNTKSVRLLRAVAPAVIQALPGVVRLTKNLWKKRGKNGLLPEQTNHEQAENGTADNDGV